ncbi:MAG: hypothetical protein HY862_19245 [Chloroflexi bacterium]|nr:hypothetical protein [Chloroflexota bacterium]
MDYKSLHWESIAFLQEHLYQRLTDPLNKAITFLELAGGQEFTLSNPKLIDDAGRNLEILMMLIKSWSVLIEWKHKGRIAESEFLPLAQEKFPEWLLTEIGEQAVLRLEHTRTLKVQHDTFFEGLILLVNVAKTAGEISHIMSNDAEEPHTGVWLRVVFKPPKPEGFQSRAAVLDYLVTQDALSQEAAIQYTVADDLFTINSARFSLQKNTRTGHQAFAMLVPAAGRSASAPPRLADMTPSPISALLPQTGSLGTLVLAPLTATPTVVVEESVIAETPIPVAIPVPVTSPIIEPETTPVSTPIQVAEGPVTSDSTPLAKKLTLLEIVKRTETSDTIEGDKSETLIINPFKVSGINMAPPEPLTLPPQAEIPTTESVPLNSLNSVGMGALSKALLQMHAEAEAKLSTSDLTESASDSRDEAANASLSGGEQPDDSTNSGSSASA